MGKKSKFKLKDGKSTGYAVVYHVVDEDWRLFRGITMDEAKNIINTITQWPDVEDVALVHVVDTWQRSIFDDKAL